VVDAAEGPLPQTYLHAYLIALLGIRQMILVINKMDLVAYDRGRFQFLAHHLSHHLQRIGIPPVAVIPISAQQGDHLVRPSDRMPWNSTHTVVETMEELLAQEEEECQPLRFLVQCLFPGMGRQAILGKVASGALQRGQAILFHPGVHRTVVTAVLLGEQEAPGAAAGESVGLLLEDALPVKRGQIGSDVDHSPWVTDRLPVKMFWIHPQPLEVRDRIEVLCGTQTRKACVEAITRVIDPVSLTAMETEATRLKDSQVAEAVLRTDTPICIDPFDIVPELGRFAILRRGRIVGGGVIAE
jgi:bifunctional enzyme CysN/CysC